jgi:hypothetical protein
MKGRRIHIAAGIVALALIAVGAAALALDQARDANAQAAPSPGRLAAASLIVEVNATDGDAGLQFFLDGEPWRSMTISGQDGGVLLTVNGQGRLRDYGLTELFSESSEPPFTEFPFEEFKALFPEGRYRFVGTTIDGKRVTGSATLSHDVPDGPAIVAPQDGATVARDNLVARWTPVTTPAGIEIAGYRAIVTREDPLRVFSVDLPASATSVTVPAEFLEAGIEYKLEVQAIAANGNQTLTEIVFTVS